jgi:colicin import membrane protein
LTTLESSASAGTLTAQTSSAPGTSLAETVLAQAQAAQAAQAAPPPGDKAKAAPAAAGKATAQATAEAQAEKQGAADDAMADVASGKLSWGDALKRVPPDVAKLMRGMQADYTRKTQELASAKKEALAEREALLKGARELKTREVPEYDPFNEESIQARIENEVAKRLGDMLKPMQDEYEIKAAEASYQTFITENPDLKTDTALRSEVQRQLEANPGLDLETAYWAAKGRAAKSAAAKAAAESAAAAENDSAKRKANKAAAYSATQPVRRGPAADTAQSGKVGRATSNEAILAMARARQGQ